MSVALDQTRPYPDEIPSGAYGADGRPSFFSDPCMDRLLAAFLDLASETWVLKERLMTLEDVLVAGGIDRAAIAEYEPDPAAIVQRDAARDQFVNRVLGQLREKR